MSAAFGLVRFKKTNNIYYCCYEGTSDIVIPFICTPQECYDNENDCYRAISYCRKLDNNAWEFPKDTNDVDDVEIYSDYGDGLYWDAKGSETIKMIKNNLEPYEYPAYESLKHGQPEWVAEFLKHQE